MNGLLEIVGRYGGPEEINRQAAEARKLDNLLARLRATGSPYLADLGLVTHPMASFNETELKRILHIPDDVRVVVVTPLAYPAAASYDEAAQERLSQRTRKDWREMVYFNRWGEAEPT